MPSVIHSVALSGIEGIPVDIETSTQFGKPQLMIIGLGDQAVKEASERIQSAIMVSGLAVPKMKIVINLAPGDLRKKGSHFELGMAIGLLKQTGQMKGDCLPYYALFGELSLDGRLRGCAGMLSLVLAAKEYGWMHVIVPRENLAEASVVEGLHVFGFDDLVSVVSFLDGKSKGEKPAAPDMGRKDRLTDASVDFADIQGQPDAIQAALVAAAGGHNLLMVGTPGCGKTMIAQRIPSILPRLEAEESTEVTKIYSVAGLLTKEHGLIKERPFRAPHHNVSLNALIGGGPGALPGEVSLAHHGVLFLDELAEHPKRSLDALRQPMEDGWVTVSRVYASHRFPAQFMFVGAMNPCPCGHRGSTRCCCTTAELERYHRKLSGPLLDRMDIHLGLEPVSIKEMAGSENSRSSADMQAQVHMARQVQKRRFQDIPEVFTNGRMNQALIKAFCPMEKGALKLLQETCEVQDASARFYSRMMRLSRTIADLNGVDVIRRQEVHQALQWQPLQNAARSEG